MKIQLFDEYKLLTPKQAQTTEKIFDSANYRNKRIINAVKSKNKNSQRY